MSELRGPRRLLAWLGNNAIQVDPRDAEASLRGDCPQLLQEDERIEFAFKVERDKFYFTTKRLLFKNKKAVTGLKINYRSVPYSSMTAFSVQTAGEVLDADSEVTIWTEMFSLGQIVLNFVKGMVDVFPLQQFLNAKVLDNAPLPDDVAGCSRPAPPPAAVPDGGAEELLNWLGGDAGQVDAAAVEQRLRAAAPVLHGDERVELAFKCGRDSTLLTTKRILIIDVKGWTGKKIEYRSILYKTIRAFSLQTAGEYLDRDAEMRIWTSMPSMRVVAQDLRKGKADVMAIQRFLTNRVLGLSAAERSTEAAPHAVTGGTEGGVEEFVSWLGDDARQIDAAMMDHRFHHSVPVLQDHEHVEMAFKGRRDLVLFTTKRLMIVDVKGWTGKKVQYLSVPWTTVQAFAVRSAGAVLDKDSEMMIWTDIMHEPKLGDDPPKPGMAYLEQDFRKDKVDLMAIHRYLSARVLAASSGRPDADAAVSPEVLADSPPGGVESFLSWLGDDARQIDARAVDEQLHTVNPMLQSDERVELAFKVGRDMTLFTSKRALLIDVQGWTGAKVEYKSVPYAALRAFAVESAGAFDRDAQVKLYPRAPWMSTVRQDLRKGRADVVAIQRFLAAKVLGPDGAVPAEGPVPAALPDLGGAGGFDAFLAWAGGDARQIDHREVDRQLHSSPPILQSEERVELAFKVGRDLCLLTSKRVLLVDVQGLTGKKVEYKSVPYASCLAFAVQSAGQFDRDAETVVWTDVPGVGTICQDLWKGKADIFTVQSLLASKILGR